MRAFGDGAFVRPAGQDVRSGAVLVPEGRRLSGPELGLLASSGHASALVYPRPRVVVLSTGDELVEPGRPAAFGMIRDANSYTLFGAPAGRGRRPRTSAGSSATTPRRSRRRCWASITRADCFISSGGVSVGERDVVKKAFFRRGDIDFYRVAMQPGMPQAFGFIEEIPYFGLPGNPVSVFVSFEVFIRPALLKMMGRRDIFRPEIWAVLDSDITGPKEKVQFARVRVWRERGQWHAASTGPSASNLLGTVTRANGLAIVPIGRGDGPRRIQGPGHAVPGAGGVIRERTPRAGPLAWSRSAPRRSPHGRPSPSARSGCRRRPARRWSRGRRRATRWRRPRWPGSWRRSGPPSCCPSAIPSRSTGASVVLEADPTAGAIRVEATVRANDRTGVEMESLTAAAVAAL